MKVILLPTAEAVLAVNQYVCEQGGNPHYCYDVGKVESAITTAFYPGAYPFALGGLAKVAGALCFYLVKAHAFMDGNKRTGVLTAITFMNQHGMDLLYPLDPAKGVNALAEVVESCAASKLGRDELMEWFESHNMWIED